MRLLLDEHLSPRIAEQLRRRGHDVRAVAELTELRAQPDDVVLEWATTERRAIVTEDVVDFLRLHRECLARGRAHGGLVLTSRRRFPRNSNALAHLVDALDQLLRSSPGEAPFDSDAVWL